MAVTPPHSRSPSHAAFGPAPLERAIQPVLRAVAIDGLTVGVGGRLPTISHYQKILGVGAGTIQEAMRILATAGALSAVARGHLGRQVSSIDVGALWQLAGFRAVRCLLPPPGSLEVRGLVEALSGEFDRLGVPHAIAHRRGAPSRIESVMTESFDVAVVSSGLGSRAGEGTLDSDLPTLELGEDTYYAHDRMRVVMRGDWDESTPPQQTRVAVDRASWDQEELTEAEFPPALGFTYVDCDFPRAPVAVARGDADVAVWHQLELLVPLDLVGLTTRSLRSPAAQERRRRLSGAVAVMSPTRPELSPLLHHVDVAAVRRRQTHLLSLPPGHPELIDNAWSL